MKMPAMDLEYELEKRYVTSLRSIFAFDNKFIYNEDDEKTLIQITPDYPEKDAIIKYPHIVVTNISFDVNLDNTLNRNFAYNMFDTSGMMQGSKFLNIIPYSITMLCLAELFESKDLSNKLVNYISFSASEVFDVMGLHVTRVSKGVSTPQQQFGEKVFQTPVSVIGNIHWQGTRTVDFDVDKVLQKIQSNIQIK